MRVLLRLLARWPSEKALLIGSVVGLLALLMMVAGVLLGTPLWVVASMSVAQGLGAVAGLTFVLSVAADAGRKSTRSE